eukprot:Phypoly_transcript_19875.p1 GENE.Phypoly_transcript_19875~~Phypoly_transcript_19875.p1  ORF type:complete len:103 (+),score=2.13 Phypoly_transcript_19875:179-487(+)
MGTYKIRYGSCFTRHSKGINFYCVTRHPEDSGERERKFRYLGLQIEFINLYPRATFFCAILEMCFWAIIVKYLSMVLFSKDIIGNKIVEDVVIHNFVPLYIP